MIGERLESLLKELPAQGPFFPHISKLNASARAAEFCRRCRILKIQGVSLHSYRYAWAQRAKSSGYPARWAENALGHNSRAVHEVYARGAESICPSLEEYEKKHSPLRLHAGSRDHASGS
jgi:integrase